MICNSYFEALLEKSKQRLADDYNKYSTSPEGVLWRNKRNGKYYYYQATKNNSKCTRKSVNKDPEMLRALARKGYLKVEISALENNIRILQKTLAGYESPFMDDLLERLPTQYRALPESYFMEHGISRCKWSTDYEKSDYKSEELRHTTSRGLKTRSKSELLIAEKLYDYNVAFRYEPVMRIGSRSIIPDFEIIAADGSTFIWEHCGRTFDAAYMEKHYEKMKLYASIGIVPWKNLIITYDDENGNIHLGIIDSEIQNKLV